MAKRAFQAIVLFFAIYAFVFVPLGKRTGIEHVRAIAGTPAARQAASEIKGGVVRLVERLRSEAAESTESADRTFERDFASGDPTEDSAALQRAREGGKGNRESHAARPGATERAPRALVRPAAKG